MLIYQAISLTNSGYKNQTLLQFGTLFHCSSH